MKLKISLIILIIIPTLLINKITKAEVNNYNEKIYKVGVIDFIPYSGINENGEFEGYYIDFFDLIAEELGFKYEYVEVNNFEAINKLEAGELDFSLGITITDERAEKLIFNLTPIASEKFALYTNRDIDPYNLGELNGLKFGAIEERAADWVIDFFKASNIDVEIIYRSTYEEINDLLKNGSIDLLLDSAYKETEYNKIYEFVDSQVYIAANKNNKEIINAIDDAIVRINNNDPGSIENLYNSYFDKEKLKMRKLERVLFGLLKSILAIGIIIIVFPRVKKLIYSISIKIKIKSNRYEIDYEPIYKVKNKKLIGFEAIIKDKIKNKYLDSSNDIIYKIKEKNVVSYICIFGLEKIISDYKKIQNYNFLKEKDFYLSINIPIDQFKDSKFVHKLIEILNKSNLRKNSICIEFMGNINTKEVNTISKNIKILKEAGFLIAIDDFGIEYSNMNIIQDLDIDIIKIDRIFTSNMDKSVVKSEIIKFISRIGKAQNKFIVLEGIDEIEQDEKIKEIDNDKLYAQGNFYSKIMLMEDIKIL